MKKKFQRCDNCNDETVHSYKKVFSNSRGRLRRDITQCQQCGKKTIKSHTNGTYTISGKNERGG